MAVEVVEEHRAPAGVAPPRWLIFATVALTVLMLYMAVAETTAWTHYFIDQGEYIALIGLGFVLVAGVYLYFRQRLKSSLVLFLPWFVYPVITQGDQLIDNMAINQMRVVVHLILAVIFAAPVAVLVLAFRQILKPKPDEPMRQRFWTVVFPGLRLIERGQDREGVLLMTLTFLLIELWVAHSFLGSLMVATLAVMGVGVLFYGSFTVCSNVRGSRFAGVAGEKAALAVLIAGVFLSFSSYLFYKSRPTTQVGSLAHEHSAEGNGYALDHNLAPASRPDLPTIETAEHVRAVLDGYSRALNGLFDAYYILDRNYNYRFHNELFLRNTPVMYEFRSRALAEIADMKKLAWATTAKLEEIDPLLPADRGLAAFLYEIHHFVEHNFERAAELEVMSAEFEKTKAGLQHATHLYEGEAKVMGIGLMEVLAKHKGVMESAELAELSTVFVVASNEIFDAYANRIVGF